MLNRLLGNNVTLNKFIEAAKTGGDAGLATVRRYINENRNNVANINAANQYGSTALICAANNGHAPIVTALLAIQGIDINHANQYGDTALIWAAIKGHAPIVTALLAIQGIDINHANQYGDTALICAAIKGHAPIVTALLAIQGIDINHANQYGDTALIWAANNGHAPIVTALLAIQGIDINAVSQNGSTALICAANNGHAPIVTALLAIQGIDINHANQYGNTALIWAASNGHAPIVTALLAIQGIDINHANQYGDTALICAANNGHAPIVTALLAIQGIDINAVSQNGSTALICAANNGHAPIVTALLAIQGIDINHAGRNRDTALHWGAYKGNETIVKALLAKITNVNYLKLENDDHRTPAQEAERQRHPEIAALIVARITELERLQNNLEEKNPNPAPVVPKISLKEQLKDIYEGEFPDDFCCPFSFELMEDAITLEGVTFDRQYILSKFKDHQQELTVKWPYAPGGTIIFKKSEVLTAKTTWLVMKMIKDWVTEQKEKNENKNLNEGISPLLENEEKVRPADEQYDDILLPSAFDFVNPAQAEPLFAANHHELKQENNDELEKLIATKKLAEAFLKSFESLASANSLSSTVTPSQPVTPEEAKVLAPKSPATIERERMIASRIKLLGEKPKLNPVPSSIPSSSPTSNPN